MFQFMIFFIFHHFPVLGDVGLIYLIKCLLPVFTCTPKQFWLEICQSYLMFACEVTLGVKQTLHMGL